MVMVVGFENGKHGSFTSSDGSSTGSLVQHDKEPPGRTRWLNMEPMKPNGGRKIW
jgi:hypothetical protein